MQRAVAPPLRANPESKRHVSVLSRYINSFKGAATRYARASNIEFAWHNRYHDHMIRNNKDGSKISEYILNNIAKWQYDRYHVPREG